MSHHGKASDKGNDKRALPDGIVFGMDTLDILTSPPPMYDLMLKMRHGDEKAESGLAEVVCDYLRIDASKSLILWGELNQRGEASYAVYTREVAETKMSELNYLFRSRSCPVFCTMKKSGENVNG